MSAEMRSIMNEIVYQKPAPAGPLRAGSRPSSRASHETVGSLLGVPGAGLRELTIPGYKKAPEREGARNQKKNPGFRNPVTPFDRMGPNGVHGGPGNLPGQMPDEDASRTTAVRQAHKEARGPGKDRGQPIQDEKQK